MAVAHVAAGGTTQSNAGEAFSPSIPAGSNGDLLVLECFTYSGTVPTPSGWNLAFNAVGLNGSDAFYVFWRIRDGSEGSSVSVDPNNARTYGKVHVWSGHNTNRPIGAWCLRTSNVNGTDPVAPGIYAPAGSAVICTGIQCNDWTDFTDLSGDGLTWTRIGGQHSPSGTTRSQGTNYALVSTALNMSDKTFVASGGASSLLYGLTYLISPANIEDVIVTSTGAGSMTAPAGSTAMRVEAHGGGGGGTVTTGAEGGGGSGSTSTTNSISVTGGSDTIYYSVGTGGAAGASGGDSWARRGTNSVPTSTTDGCRAIGGGSSASATGGAGGANGSAVGDVKWSGINGANGQGGGGSRAGSGGGYGVEPGGNAGTNPTTGASNTPGVGGIAVGNAGSGGNAGVSGASGNPGQAPGGGGGGGGNSGGNGGAGARGQIRLIFTISGPAVGVAIETDTAYNRGLVNGHGQSNETDTAFKPGGPTVVIPVSRPIETDTAFNRGMALQPQRADETDSAFALSQGIVQLPVGQANETDAAFKAGGIGMAPNRPIETDTAFNRGIVLPVQRANETDTAFERPRLGGVGVAIEADTAFALGKLFILPIGRAPVANGDFSSNYLSEYATFDSSISVVAGRLRVTANNTSNVMATATFPSIGAGLGTGNVVRVQGEGFAGTANAVVRFGNGATGLASQTNTAFDLSQVLTGTSVKIDCTLNDMGAVTVGQFAEFDNFIITTWPREVDTAFALNRLDTPAWTRSNEVDSAFSLVYGVPVARANEADTAFARAAIFIRPVTRADETDSAFALNRLVTLSFTRANETDSAFRLGFGSPAQRANEVNTAFARNALITIEHGFSTEIDTAFQMFGALEAGSGRKPYVKGNQGILRDRRQPVHKVV